MTLELLRTQLLTLLPSQVDDLIRDQLSPEEAAHVPTRPASPAERAGVIVTLAGQNASLRQRLEAALQSLSGETTPAGVPDSVVEWVTSTANQLQWIRIVGFQERYKIRLALEDIFVPLRTRVGRRKQQSLRGDKLAEDFVESRVVDLPEALRVASETPATAGLVVLRPPCSSSSSFALLARAQRPWAFPKDCSQCC